MKYWFFTIIVFLQGFLASGQSPGDEYIIKAHLTKIACQEMAIEYTEIIPSFFRENQTDSLLAYFYQWELKCGLAEPLLRMYLLYQIATNTFSDDFYPDHLFDYLDGYREISNFEYPHYYFDHYSWAYDSIHPSFNPFTVELAKELQGYDVLSGTESFLVEFYGNDFDAATDRLNSRQLKGTRLDSLYNRRIQKRHDNAIKPYVSFMAGVWLPRGNLALLGNHPQVGFGGGYHKNWFFLDLNLTVAFLPSKNEYEVSYIYQRHTVRGFTNFNISLTFGTAIPINRKPIFHLGLGLGYESIMAISPKPEYDEPGKFINSFFAGPLLEFRFPVSEKHFIGFYTRYNFLGFHNKPGTNLSGNAQWLGVKFGINLHDQKKFNGFSFSDE